MEGNDKTTASFATFDLGKANALMSEWMKRQQEVFDTVSAKFPKPESGNDAPELWRSYMEFWNTLSKVMPTQAGAQESVMQTLVGPAMGTLGASPLDDMVGRITEGPGFATLWDWDRKALKVYSAGLALRQAASAYQAILDLAWQKAYKDFLAEFKKPVENEKQVVKTWRAGIELWFSIANQSLLETQRSEEFLAAQRTLLRTAMDYRLTLRQMAEEFCDLYQVPGRSEVDDLARTVHGLRRELRELKRQARSVASPLPAGDGSGVREAKRSRVKNMKAARKGKRRPSAR